MMLVRYLDRGSTLGTQRHIEACVLVCRGENNGNVSDKDDLASFTKPDWIVGFKNILLETES